LIKNRDNFAVDAPLSTQPVVTVGKLVDGA